MSLVRVWEDEDVGIPRVSGLSYWVGEINPQDQGQGQKSGDLLRLIKPLLSMLDTLQKIRCYRSQETGKPGVGGSGM